MKTSRISQVLARFDFEKDFASDIKHTTPLLFGKEKEYQFDVANSLDSKIETYQLIYRLYKEMGYATDEPTGMWYSLFNAQANTTTLIVRNVLTKKIMATLTIVFDGVLGLPLEDYYPNEMAILRNKKRKCAEIISLGFDETVRGSSEILIQLFKYAYVICNSIYFANDILIKIKPNHAFFYQRKLLFEPLGKEVRCAKMNNGRAQLYHLDLEIAKTQIFQENKYNKNNNREIYQSCVQAQNCKELVSILKEKIYQAEMSSSDLEYLFIHQKEIFDQTSPEIILKISTRYKNEDTKIFLRNCAHYQLEHHIKD